MPSSVNAIRPSSSTLYTPDGAIGAFHFAAGRIARDADKARDSMNSLVQDFDRSETLDDGVQEVTRQARAADVATLALGIARHGASAS